MASSAVLLIHCPDRKGLVSAISSFLYALGANILHADQHRDNQAGLFFMRVEWDLTGFELGDEAFRTLFRPVAETFEMRWQVAYSDARPAVAIFVSRYQHCLADLLYRYASGELRCRLAAIVSNHADAQAIAGFYDIPFHAVRAEEEQLELLEREGVELVVLARYMQILSPAFVARYPQRILNVHHSFLPAFSGARPYHAAYERGVKLIGATSHYVTEALDEGPIIEQDVLRISHRDQVSDLIQKGRDLERVVLSRAVRWHLDHRVLHYSGKTVVFD